MPAANGPVDMPKSSGHPPGIAHRRAIRWGKAGRLAGWWRVTSAQIRDLRGTVDRENAALGILITLEPPSKAMEQEAISAGFYHSPGWGQNFPRIQILAIEQLLGGELPQMPPHWGTFKQAQAVKADPGVQIEMDIQGDSRSSNRCVAPR